MREIELLTETSTQIRVSAEPKTLPRPFEGEQKIITGTPLFGKCLLRSNFRSFPTWNRKTTTGSGSLTEYRAALWYD
jgi:hypothetical protein